MVKLQSAKDSVHVPLIHKRGNKTPVHLNSIEAMKPEDDHKVRGTFVNVEAPGVAHKFSLGNLYKGASYFCETLKDNETCVIPYSVARFINERFSNDKHSYIQDEKGNPIKDGAKTPRGKFLIEEHLK